MTGPVALTCHPQTNTDAVRGIQARVSRAGDGGLRLGFRLAGALARLRVPARRTPSVVEGLWRHTCFEAFLAVDGSSAYHELNFAPSGEWAVLAFQRYREREPLPTPLWTPRIVVTTTRDHLDLDVLVALDCLSPAYASAPLRLALAAVVEESSSQLSYWSLHHPAGAPDFHHGDAFVLRLEPGC